MTEQPDRTYWTGHLGPDRLDTTAGTGQFGQISLTLRLNRIERKGWPKRDSKERAAGIGQPGHTVAGQST
jgi:hypothetical protein